MSYNYLIDAANKMIGSIEYDPLSGVLNERSLDNFFETGCKTLRQLSADAEFKKLVSVTIADFKANQTTIATEFGSASAFVETFRKIEREGLLKAGVQSKVANYLLKDAKRIEQILDPTNLPNDADQIFPALNHLTSTVCDEAGRRTDKKKRQGLLKRASQVVGGASLVSVNMSVDFIAAYGLVSKLSGAFGIKYVIDGVRGA